MAMTAKTASGFGTIRSRVALLAVILPVIAAIIIIIR